MSVTKIKLQTVEGEIRITGEAHNLYWWADDMSFAIDEAIRALEAQHGSDPLYVDTVMPTLHTLRCQIQQIQKSTGREVLNHGHETDE